MKILEINKFHYIKGGSERYVFSVSNALAEAGHELMHFSMKSPENEMSKESDYFVDYMDMHKFSLKNIVKFFYNYEAVAKLKKLIKDKNPDLAHLHNIAHQLTPAIIKVLKDAGIPVIMTLHDYKLICPNAKLYNKNGNCEKCLGGKYYNCFLNSCMHESRAKSFLGMLEAYIYKYKKSYDLVDLFIAPSQYMKDVTVKFGIDENKIIVIRNFLNNSAELAESADTENYFLYFGRLSEEKGIFELIEAFDSSEFKNYKLKIVGDGPSVNDLRFKIKDLGLEDKIDLLGYKSGDELKDLIQRAKAVVMPSLWAENMPYALLEACDMGKICIVSRVGGMPELIEDSQNGYLFEAGNKDELAKSMKKVLNMSENEKKTMGENAKKTANEINKQKHLEKLIDIFTNIRAKNH